MMRLMFVHQDMQRSGNVAFSPLLCHN